LKTGQKLKGYNSTKKKAVAWPLFHLPRQAQKLRLCLENRTKATGYNSIMKKTVATFSLTLGKPDQAAGQKKHR
jgi:hypothetical protein